MRDPVADFARFEQLLGAPPPAGDSDPLVTLVRRHRGRTTRPWVAVTMVTSLDGATAVDGRSGALGGPADQALFRGVRRSVDVVLVGRATAAAEHYRPSAIPGQRIGVITRGLDRSRDAELLDSELLADGHGFLVMPAGAAAPPGIDVVRAGDAGDVDLAGALTRLGDAGVVADVVGLEGGPLVNGAAIAAGVVDELNLTLAGLLVGGDSARVAIGAPVAPLAMRLVHLLAADGMLFGRWVRADAIAAASPSA